MSFDGIKRAALEGTGGALKIGVSAISALPGVSPNVQAHLEAMAARLLPTGGSTAQVPIRQADGSVAWGAQSGGGPSQPFPDNTALVKNNTDATKLIRVDASGVAPGTTRVLTMPNLDVTLANVPGIASQAQADAGTDDATIITPLKLASGTQRGKLTESDLYGDFWVSGSAPSSGVSRTGAAVPSQTVYVGGIRFVVPSTTNTFAASTTTYIDVTTAGAFSFNTSASPTGGALRLYSVVTDATNITAVGDLRQPPTAVKGRRPTGLFRASVNAVQSIASATLSPVKFHVEEVDLDGWFVPGTGATQSRYTPLKRGWYKFGGMVTYQDGTDQQHMRVYAYKNGAVFKALAWTPESGASFIGGGSVTEIWCDGVSDYLELYTYHTFTGAHNVYSDPSLTWVSGYYLGDTLTATA